MPYGEKNDPIVNLLLGIILTILGLLFFFHPPTPGEKMSRNTGDLRAPPVIITRLFSIGTIWSGVSLIRNSIKNDKD